ASAMEAIFCNWKLDKFELVSLNLAAEKRYLCISHSWDETNSGIYATTKSANILSLIRQVPELAHSKTNFQPIAEFIACAVPIAQNKELTYIWVDTISNETATVPSANFKKREAADIANFMQKSFAGSSAVLVMGDFGRHANQIDTAKEILCEPKEKAWINRVSTLQEIALVKAGAIFVLNNAGNLWSLLELVQVAEKGGFHLSRYAHACTTLLVVSSNEYKSLSFGAFLSYTLGCYATRPADYVNATSVPWIGASLVNEADSFHKTMFQYLLSNKHEMSVAKLLLTLESGMDSSAGLTWFPQDRGLFNAHRSEVLDSDGEQLYAPKIKLCKDCKALVVNCSVVQVQIRLPNKNSDWRTLLLAKISHVFAAAEHQKMVKYGAIAATTLTFFAGSIYWQVQQAIGRSAGIGYDLYHLGHLSQGFIPMTYTQFILQKLTFGWNIVISRLAGNTANNMLHLTLLSHLLQMFLGQIAIFLAQVTMIGYTATVILSTFASKVVAHNAVSRDYGISDPEAPLLKRMTELMTGEWMASLAIKDSHSQLLEALKSVSLPMTKAMQTHTQLLMMDQTPVAVSLAHDVAKDKSLLALNGFGKWQVP
ncbi:hypothetical protein HK100_007888, partial [Physocladia obscura]